MGRTSPGMRIVSTALVITWLIVPAAVVAQDQTDTTAEATLESSNPTPPVPKQDPGEHQRRTAKRIDELIAGTLDPDIDPADLFREDLVATDADITGNKLAGLFEPPSPPPPPPPSKAKRGQARRRKPPPVAPQIDPAEKDLADLHDARQRFLSLPPQRQAEILRIHADRRIERDALARRDDEHAAVAKELQERAQRIRALVRGELDVSLEPAPLLVLDLSAPWVGEAVRAGILVDAHPTEQAALHSPLVEAGRDVLAALAEFRDRSEPERQALLNLHAKRQIETIEAAKADTAAMQDESRHAQDSATRAAEERVEALIQAQEAASHTARLGAKERARLLGVREAQALFEADLIRRTTVTHEREAAIAQARTEFAELARRIDADEAPASEAEARWPELRTALTKARRDFRQAIQELDTPSDQVPEVGEGVDLAEVAEDDRTGLRELREALRSEASRLGVKAADARTEDADTLSRQVATLNDARLLLLVHMDSALRDRLTGFGIDGLEQASGALEQARLQVRWRIRSIPKAFETARIRFLRAPENALLALIYLAGLLMAFRWWRRHADATLDRASLHWETRRPATLFTRSMATGFGYLRSIRQPIEWLVLILAVRIVAGDFSQLPEARIVWLVLKWLLLAGVIIHGVDALVERFATRIGVTSEDRRAASELRRKSLRLIGLVAIVIGLGLSGIRDLLGQGTLYAWAGKLTWLLVLPAIVVLVRWWKPTVYERLQPHQAKNTLAARILVHPTGIRGFVGATIGGMWLLGDGMYRWLMTQIGGVSAYRRAHAYLFRREVQRQAQLREQVEVLPLLSGPAAAALASEGPANPWVAGPPERALDDLVSKVRQPVSNLFAVVGERGLGKTTFLAALQLRVADTANLALSCPGNDLGALMSRLAVALDLPADADDASIRSALIDRDPKLVTIDDCQRLIRPAIGGLDALARLVELARNLPMKTTWVLALESPAWHFLSRAMAPQPMFDRVVTLSRWSEDRITELLSSRTTRAGITPRFDSLIQDANAPPEALLGDKERTQRGFFRMLWDFSDGNPSVALHFWRTSLRQRPDGEVQVLLFDAPEPTDLESMPLPVLFVLRALVQMGQATAETLAAATREPLHDVQDVLRFGAEAGWLDRDKDAYRLSWQWYRAVTRVLSRQHLLVV